MTFIHLWQYIIAIGEGAIVGFAAAVPIGPVGIICVQRTITRGRFSGLITGLGAAAADGLLASIGAFGITIIYNFIVKEQSTIRLVGCFILIFLGLSAVFSKNKSSEDTSKKYKDTAIHTIEQFISAFILTITNPLTAITFFAAFTALESRGGHRIFDVPYASSLVFGVVLGSCLWWLLLTYIAEIFEHRINQESMGYINKIFGIIILIVGFILLETVFFK